VFNVKWALYSIIFFWKPPMHNTDTEMTIDSSSEGTEFFPKLVFTYLT
jgi:hypothetical protein